LKPNADGWLWSEELRLWVGPWRGDVLGYGDTWLRFFDKEARLVLDPSEAARLSADEAKRDAEKAKALASVAEAEAAALRAKIASLEAKSRNGSAKNGAGKKKKK
jgi:hypothetical protein